MRPGTLRASVSVLVLVDLFVVHDLAWLSKHAAGGRFQVNYLGSTAFVAIVLFLCVTVLGRRRRPVTWIAAGAALALPMIAELTHFRVYKNVIDVLGFDFASKNGTETVSYFLENTSPFKVGVTLLAVAFAMVSLWHGPPPAAGRPFGGQGERAPAHARGGGFGRLSARARGFALLGRAWVAFCALLLPTLAYFGTFNWYSVSLYQNGVFSFYTTYIDHLSRRSTTFRVQRESLPPNPAPTTGIPNIVWIIGESAAKHHMQIYGYDRPTTPGLQKLADDGALLAFDDMLAIGNKTMLSVPYMLFGLEGPDPGGRIYKQPSIFGYAKARGMRTAFVSAQDIRWYRFDALVVDKSIDYVRAGPDFSSNVDVRNGADDLKVVEEGVLPFLDAGGPPAFLVYQMNGSHYPYSDHSPPGAKIFLPEGEKNSRNAYDNSIAYTDRVLAGLLERLRRTHKDTWVFYVSDHGQALASDDLPAFHAGYGDAVIKPPFLAFHTAGAHAALRGKTKAPLSQVDIFATVLDLIGQEPVQPIDGFSLLGEIPRDRVRICSEYMPTFSNNPNAALFLPDLGPLRLDFKRGEVSGADEKATKRIDQLDANVLSILRRRL